MQKRVNGSGAGAAAGSKAKLQQSEQSAQKGLAKKASCKKRRPSADEQWPSAALVSRSKKAKTGEASQSCKDGKQDAARCSSAGHPAAEVALLKRKGKKATSKGLTCTEEGAEEVVTQPQQKQHKRKSRVVHVVSGAKAPALSPFQATPRTGWWGARRFASAGKPLLTLGAMPCCANTANATGRHVPAVPRHF